MQPTQSNKSVLRDPLHPRPIPVRTPVHASNTGDRRCLHQAATWLRRCLRSHSCCNESFGHDKRDISPTRILSVHGEGVRIRMTSKISGTNALEYMTLSHRWGRNTMPKLLKINMKQLQESIDIFA
jgi:hypothetical protein